MIKTKLSAAKWKRPSQHGALVAVILLATISALTLATPTRAEALAPGIGAPTPVYRWWHSGDKDWVSVPAHGSQMSDPALIASGYTKNPTPQFYVSMIGTPDPGMVAVYRWWRSGDKDWMDVRDGYPSDTTLVSQGYSSKTFLYYAYSGRATGRVAVNRWRNAADKDWATYRQNEVSSATLKSQGYTNKTRIAYASSSQSPTGEMGYFNLAAGPPR